MARSVVPSIGPRQRLGCFALVYALTCVLPWLVHSGHADTGMWTDTLNWSGADVNRYAVHLMLVPGDNHPYHSRILWLKEQLDNQIKGGKWVWWLLNYGCSAYPTANFDSLGLDTCGLDMFCDAHIMLADGREMHIGGTSPVTLDYGERKSRIFKAGLC